MSQRVAPDRSVFDSVTDEQIVERVVQGDTALFEILMRRNNPRVYRAIRALIRDEAEVEDAMQAAYINAFTKLHSFRGGARFSTWLTQVAMNEALGRIRWSHRHPSSSLSLVLESEMSTHMQRPATPEVHANRRELAALLERAVDQLPELYRTVFMLREVDGMSTAEAATVLDVTEEVVKTRLSRAKSALRDAIDHMVGEANQEAFAFHAVRCDRIVQTVMSRILPSTPDFRP